MRKTLCAVLFAVALLTALPVYAQNPNYDLGPVWRVTFWKDFREHVKPSYDALKKEGLISDYKVWTNVTTDGPHDWDIAVGLLVSNWAAIDQLDAHAATILAKHYGSREAMIEAGKKRNEIREVVASKLAREVKPK